MAAAGRVDPRLEADPLPPEAAPLWDVFRTLAASRGSGMAPQPIAMTDIEAWCRMHRLRLTSWELDTLLMLDVAALATVANNRKSPPP